MDNRSPAHNDFQVYNGNETTTMVVATVLTGPVGLAATGQGTAGHILTESRPPTDAEQNTMADEIRAAFLQTYGKDSYNNSVSESERKKRSNGRSRRAR